VSNPRAAESNNRGKIEGTKWASRALTVEGVELPPATLVWHFGADGTFRYEIGPSLWTGNYFLEAGDSVRLHFEHVVFEKRKQYATKIRIDGRELTILSNTEPSWTAPLFTLGKVRSP